MIFAQTAAVSAFSGEIRSLFYQRTLICLWLAVVFFSFFSILDYVCCREHFLLFFMYRLSYVVVLVCFINLLSIRSCKRYAPFFIYTAMLLGGLVISLMTVHLGGFYSGYYVGILLMIAGALSVLPLKISQVLFIGLSMYAVYVSAVLLGSGDLSNAHLVAMANNSFFFLALVAVTAVQSYDDLQTLLKSLGTTKKLKGIRTKLTDYRENLEGMVQRRMSALEESDLKYRDLYDAILDFVVLIDTLGVIRKVNTHCRILLGVEPQKLIGKPLGDCIYAEHGGQSVVMDIVADLYQGKGVEGLQLQLEHQSGMLIDVEVSGNQVALENDLFYQLVLRDITTTKMMEKKLFDAERLIDTSRQAAIFGLARLAECRDDDTGAHLKRIRSYTRLLVEELSYLPAFREQITDQFVEDLLRSAVLHDIGKVGIPDAVLLKPGRLTKEEFEVMKNHCTYGSEILAGAEESGSGETFLNLAREITRHHHERWDGSGYPDGLAGESIPLAARIVSLADVYDALTSTRVYKAAYSHAEARDIITRERGGQFDPQVVDAFIQHEAEFKECRMTFLLEQTKRTIQ